MKSFVDSINPNLRAHRGHDAERQCCADPAGVAKEDARDA